MTDNAQLALPTADESKQTGEVLLKEIEQRKRNPGARALAGFLRGLGAQVTKNGDPDTNIIDLGERRTYNLSDVQIAQLFEHLERCRREGTILHFQERQGSAKAPYSGIMLDYDLDVPSEATALGRRHMHRLAHAIATELGTTLDYKGDLVAHIGFIVKPQAVRIEKLVEGKLVSLWRYGFHVLIPDVKVKKGYRKFLVGRLAENPQITRSLQDLGVTNSDALDKQAIYNPAHFVGSCKTGKIPYELGSVFRATADPTGYVVLEEVTPERLQRHNVCAEFSLNYSADMLGALRDGEQPALMEKREYEPREEFLSRIEDLDARTRGQRLQAEDLILVDNALSTLSVTDAEARHLHRMLELLTPDYASEYAKWIKVIMALANTSEQYRPLAEWFSQRCPEKFNAAEFERTWNDAVQRRGAHGNPVGKRSIYFWARECNPEGFQSISKDSYFEVMMGYVHTYQGCIEHYMIAKVLELMLGNKYVVDVPPRSKQYLWFEFVVEGEPMRPGEVWKWREEAEPDNIHIYMSERMPAVFDEVKEALQVRIDEAEDEGATKYYNGVLKNLRISERKIFNDGFKNGVIKQANKLFRQRNRGFYEELDQDGNLFGHGRGIFKLGPHVESIECFHEYRVSRYTRTMPGRFDPQNPSPDHQMVLDAFTSAIPEPDMRQWLLMYMSTGLYGGYKDTLMLLWEGGGQNGKTAMLMAWINALGEMYANKGPMQLLTDERRESANSPNSAKMSLEQMRAFVFEESNEMDIINPATLKEIVNPGKVSGSDKHEKQKTFKIICTLIAATNYKFLLQTRDHGTWRRLRRYVSKVKFVPHPDPNNPFEKKEDVRFAKFLVEDPHYLAAFLDILVFYYERLQREYNGQITLVPCETLSRETEDFRNSQDSLNRFISEKIVRLKEGEKPANPKDYTNSLSDVNRYYTNWYGKNVDEARRNVINSMNQIQNSKLSKYIRTIPGGALVLQECRVLEDGEIAPRPNEEFVSEWRRADERPEEELIQWLQEGSKGKWWLEPLDDSRDAGLAERLREEEMLDEQLLDKQVLDDADLKGVLGWGEDGQNWDESRHAPILFEEHQDVPYAQRDAGEHGAQRGAGEPASIKNEGFPMMDDEVMEIIAAVGSAPSVDDIYDAYDDAYDDEYDDVYDDA